MVLQALQGMQEERRCYRQVSGILIEQSVSEAKPYLASHLAGVSQENLNFRLYVIFCVF